MRLLGFEITRAKQLSGLVPARSANWYNNFFGWVNESFAGAWQRGVVVDDTQSLLAFSAVYACVSLISDDIAKLRIKLIRKSGDIWEEVQGGSPFLPVLRKPNRYQTRIQFLSSWVTSKLISGNAYILKERDNRGMVRAMYPLDPRLVLPLVAPDGSVYYQIKMDMLSGVQQELTVPASEIIHDRMVTLWHPLVGVSPIYAAGASATQGRRIQTNSNKFFENMSRPSGHLTAPGAISDEVATRLKKVFEDGFSGDNIGKLFVSGDGIKYEPMTIPSREAQLIEQLRFTAEDVARAFKVARHKIGIDNPTFNNVGPLNQDYYSHTLQSHIESIELLLDEGMGLGEDMGTELDLDGLLRMDQQAQAEVNEREIKAGYLSPNEARQIRNRAPVKGGETPYLQQQNWPLEKLAEQQWPQPAPDVIKPEEDKPTGDVVEDAIRPMVQKIGEIVAAQDAMRKSLEEKIASIDVAGIASSVVSEKVDPVVLDVRASQQKSNEFIETKFAEFMEMLKPKQDDSEMMADVFIRGLENV